MTSEHVIGRYALYDKIASGGMATVYYGRLLGPVGFSRAVAIKQLHPQYSRDHDFVSMFVDEAHVTARIRHPNTVPVLDVVKHGRELYIVMEYVLGASLSELLRRTRMDRERIPASIAASIMAGCLHGLHAAHETRDEQGGLLGVVHRDVSPSNVLVGRDGMARVLDFGIAKAAGRAQVTRHGEIKGKVGYMAPEQLRGGEVARAADVYAAAVTLWEVLTGLRAHAGDDPEDIMDQRLEGETLLPPSSIEPSLERFDDIVLRGMAADPTARWPTARDMALALEAGEIASHAAVADWLEHTAGEIVERRAAILARLEAGADAADIRAAIAADLSLADPSISVQTWTGSSLDLAELYQDVSGDGSGPRPASDGHGRSDATTREVNAISNEPRDLTPTRVEPSTPPQRSLPIALTHALPDDAPGELSAADDGTTRQVLTPMDDDDEEWHDAVARASTARPIAPVAPVSPSQRLVWTAAALMLIAGVIALAMWGGAAPPETAGAAETAPAAAATSAATAPVTATATAEPEATDVAVEPEVSPPPEPPPRAPRPRPPPPAETAASAPPPPVPNPKDPFDQLGGRH